MDTEMGMGGKRVGNKTQMNIMCGAESSSSFVMRESLLHLCHGAFSGRNASVGCNWGWVKCTHPAPLSLPETVDALFGVVGGEDEASATRAQAFPLLVALDASATVTRKVKVAVKTGFDVWLEFFCLVDLNLFLFLANWKSLKQRTRPASCSLIKQIHFIFLEIHSFNVSVIIDWLNGDKSR